MKEIKQPELGKLIQELRQEKKITQEELVEKCNLNVRTLQRIESGDVTPRDYTIRVILDVLGYDLDSIESSIVNKHAIGKVKLAWIAGIVYFILTFFETGVDYYRFEVDAPGYFSLIYTAVKILVALSFAVFLIGFIELGKYHNKSIIKIASYLLIASMVVIELYDVLTLFSDIDAEEFLGTKGIEGVAFGGFNILFGAGLINMRRQIGEIALLTGLLEIFAGILFISFVLGFLGLFILIPANILEVVILFRFNDTLEIQSKA